MPLRIVVCGDDTVGKSSLIATLVKDEFVANIQGKLSPVSISRDDYAVLGEANSDVDTDMEKTDMRSVSQYIPDSTVVIDTVSSDHAALNKELKQADVILLLYSDHYTYERVLLFWMPMFRALGVNLPIVVCANKCDFMTKLPEKPTSSFKQQNKEEFVPLINEFKEIEACLRCSAKQNINVVEAFYLCQRAVTHPISPIFDSKEGNLKPAAVKALQRVFFLCDADLDGYLNFEEFSALHMRCFGRSASQNHYDDILQTVNAIILPDCDNKGEVKGISENAFIILNKLYAERGRHETIWGILRAFHYTNSLSLNDRFLYPKVEVNPNSSVELSPTGYRFLVDLFLKFDRDNDGGLSEEEMTNLFLPTPGVPKLWKETQFPSSIVCNEEGYVSLQGWLAQWNLTTFLDHQTTLEYLAYLGFDEGNSVKAIKVTKPRKHRQKQGKQYRGAVNDRNVFNCFVLGAPKSGKSSLLELFIRGTYSEMYLPTIIPKLCVKDIELRGGKQCYLILEELGELEPAILENQKRLDQCDVICYTYDSSDPELFQYIVNLRKKHASILNDIPSVFAALKADLDKQQQRSDVQPENYIRNLFLGSPLHISSSWPMSIHELFIQLVDAAKMPSTATPGLDPHPDTAEFENMKRIGIAGGAITVMTLFSVWIFRSAQRLGRT
ncbi:mitochondrial Rho GTPase [Metschnikowia bicuspidata var. bicuspidata NRRL YB-4993]|uniref:Mitochondrial Rho GTPase n=1 Tax=Metschnikowia bicuspidata var. bicuspidata NRRL YB-4993 TaxID=869754 RepID=A0A1A0H6E3_9ASCO|nr:mitochondrial Rho GTPase [Metschnikowia bicuspidata var. bicuspidata NRRL YB-4993]OBA19659.1 mitochondrial Rho GTPase [Metschnikowia bicuspidata var. bicuspidata NRRL YB-4993]